MTELPTGIKYAAKSKRLGDKKPAPMIIDSKAHSRFLALRHSPISIEAVQLTEAVALRLQVGNTVRVGITDKRRRAVGAILSDIVRTLDEDAAGYVYRSRMAGTFTGEGVGRAPFDWAIDGMERLGLIILNRGYLPLGKPSEGYSSRFKPTDTLVSMIRSMGVKEECWADHFALSTYAVDAPLVIARTASHKGLTDAGWQRLPGSSVRIDWSHARVADDVKRLSALNVYLMSQKITPGNAFAGLTRIYNNADAHWFKYDQGGRLYDLNGEFQRWSGDKRRTITINGEAVVEIDLQASHLTGLRVLLGVAFDPGIDPYAHPDVERAVMKTYITMTLGNSKLSDKWLPAARKRFAKKNGGRDLSKEYNAAFVRDKVLDLHPFLRDWPACIYRWGDLQYTESKIVFDTIYMLAINHSIPALPIYDSILVPASKESFASDVLVDCFEMELKVRPSLKVNRSEAI